MGWKAVVVVPQDDAAGTNGRWWPGVTRALNELQRDPRFQTLRHISGTALCVMTRP